MFKKAFFLIFCLVFILANSASAATVTSSLYGNTVFINSNFADTNFIDTLNLEIQAQDTYNISKILMRATVPSGTGTITSAKISLLQTNCSTNNLPIEMRQLTQTNWVANEVTWNQYSSGNNWTTPGGDFSSTVISTSTYDCNELVWQDFWIMGGNSGNPVNVSWNQTLNLILEGTGGIYGQNTWYSFQEGATSPFLTIEYTP